MKIFRRQLKLQIQKIVDKKKLYLNQNDTNKTTLQTNTLHKSAVYRIARTNHRYLLPRISRCLLNDFIEIVRVQIYNTTKYIHSSTLEERRRSKICSLEFPTDAPR